MNPTLAALHLLAVALCCAATLATGLQTTDQPAAATGRARYSAKDISEEMQLINKSLEGLLSELALIKREATGRLSSVKNRVATTNTIDQERIRQTKVSRFVLKRVAELETESLGMRDEMVKLLELQQKQTANGQSRAPTDPQVRHQEDHDFDDDPPHPPAAPIKANNKSTTTTSEPPPPPPTTTTTTTPKSTDATTLKPEDEATAIGFDLEALKKLGEEIGKRLDQFGKDAAKNLNDLLEGVKLVFREPNKTQPKRT